MSEVKEPFLMHYGIKGMKWGIRRPLGSNGRVRSGPSVDYTVSRERKKKRISELSTPELQELNTRLQLERTNKSLQSRTALDKIKTGTAVAGTVLAAGATVNTAIQFVRSPAGQWVRNIFTK